jgi:hypothetical protein
MKRNLLKGIVLISAMALSSCSVNSKLARTTPTGDDDVYFTKAVAGDKYDMADINQQNYTRGDNDYYYYGDYASRINRFNYSSPFNYSDDFYYGYTANNDYDPGINSSQSNSYNSAPANAMYSPFDNGYLPYDDMGGYDDIGYGGLYASYLFSGGFGGGGLGYGYNRYHSGKYTRTGYTGGKNTGGSGAPLTFHSARSNNGASQETIYYPGRPTSTATAGPNRSYSTTNSSQNNQRGVRTETQNPRPVVQQTFNSAPAQSSSNSSGGGSSGGGGGGGRPAR